MLITAWQGLGDTAGVRVDVAFSALGATIEALPEGALFSCATFAGPRGEAAFECATAIVLDHDSASIPFLTACEVLKRSRALMYETRTPGRWRAILPLAEPIAGWVEYTAAVMPIAQALHCARESGTGSQMWFPPRKGYRYVSPLDGENRLMAWIKGDYNNRLVACDLPLREHDGGVDRSALDMKIATRMAEIGITREEADAIFEARNGLSHSTSAYHMDLMWRKVLAQRDGRAGESEWRFGGAAADGSADSAEPPAPSIMIGPDVHRVADQCIDALAADSRLFTRDAAIVELIPAKQGLPATRALSSASIQDRLSKASLLFQFAKGGESKRILPPKELADIVRDRGAFPPLRGLRGVIEVPILRPDGSIAEAPGYDAVTGFYRAEGLALDLAPMRHEDALARLREPFAEFQWAHPEMVDIPVALICAITCRAAVGGNVPLFVFDASKPGSGKSLLVETVSAIANGHPSGAGRFPGDDDELAKVLAGYARASKALIAFDNVTRPVQGEALDSALTCNGKVSFRILGQSKVQTCDWYSVITINGNQIRVGGDTRRRAIVSRLTPSQRRADFRLQLPRYAYEHRAELLAAAIALVRNGLLNGVPRLDHRASFEAFLKSIAGSIVAAGGYDITQFWREEEAITESDSARETMALWIGLRWPDGATASQIADDLGESFMASAEARALMLSHGLEAPLREALRCIGESHSGATKRQAMAYALHAWRDITGPGALRITGVTGRKALWRTSY